MPALLVMEIFLSILYLNFFNVAKPDGFVQGRNEPRLKPIEHRIGNKNAVEVKDSLLTIFLRYPHLYRRRIDKGSLVTILIAAPDFNDGICQVIVFGTDGTSHRHHL
jgi:hypothetical protein